MALTGYGRQHSISVNASAIDATLTDFSAFLDENILNAEMFDNLGTYPAINGGGDVKFSLDEAGETQLAYHVRKFLTDNDPANGIADIVVKIPSILAASGGTIWVWWNKAGDTIPAADSTYGSENAYDANFIAVHDLGQDPTAGGYPMTDATAKGNHLLDTAATSIATDMGDGVDTNGNSRLEPNLPLTGFPTGNDPFTWHGRVRHHSTGTAQTAVMHFGTATTAKRIICEMGESSGAGAANTYRVTYWGGTIADDTAPMTVDTWHSIGITYNPSGTLGGIVRDGATRATGVQALNFNGGSNNYELGGIGVIIQWDGDFTESRASDIVRTDPWLKAEHLNWDDTSTFMVAGTPQVPGGPPAPTVLPPTLGIGKILLCNSTTKGTNMNYDTGASTGWIINAQSGANAIYSVTTPGNQGGWSANIIINSMGTNDIDVTFISTPGFSTVANHFYWIAFDGRVTSPASGFKLVTPRISLVGCATSSLGLIISATKTLSPDWQRFNSLVKADTTTNGQLYFTMGTSGTTIQIDDVFVQEVFELFPEYDWRPQVTRSRVNNRTQKQLYTWDFGIKTKRYEFSENYVNSYTRSHINSFWQSNATMRIIENSDTPGTYNTVKCVLNNTPFNQYTVNQFEERFIAGYAFETTGTVT